MDNAPSVHAHQERSRAPAPVRTRTITKGALPLASQRRRLNHLAAITSPHLPGVVRVEEQEHQFRVTTEFVPGPVLTTLKTVRGGITLAEGWRLLADVCAALAALHHEGIVHGDLSPANIIIRSEGDRGRAVVVDVGTQEGWEAGTVGFRAPEITAGRVGSAQSDVWSAARVALWAVAPEHRQAFGVRLQPLLSLEPERRPTAMAISEKAEGEASPGIDLPDEATLAAGHLRAEAAILPTSRARSRRRRRRGVPRRFLLAAGAMVSVAALTYGIADVIGAAQDAAPQGDGVTVVPADPFAVVVDLTRKRDLALREGDLSQLTRVTIPGSPAAVADVELLDSFRGSVPVELSTEVTPGRTLGSVGEPIVEASLTQGPFTWRGGRDDGTHVAALPPRCVRFHLADFDGELRVQRVSDCAAAAAVG